jgi:S1-C subfamily serine protease
MNTASAHGHRTTRLLYRVAFAMGLLTLGSFFAPLWQATEGRAKEETPSAPAIVPRGELYDVEKATIAIFEKYSPSVVTVVNKALMSDFSYVYEVPQGTGSGIIWDRQGHVLSNFHVVQNASAVQVILKDGTSFDSKVVGLDPDHDLAVLRIDAPADKLIPVALGTSRDVKVGQRVLAIGNPFGFESSLSQGIVSSLGREMPSLTGLTIRGIIQTDAAINQGNSGAPLLDSSGPMIGINTFIVSPTGGSIGLGFAIPVDTVNRVVPQLIAYGKVKRVGLGVTLVPDRLAKYHGIEGAVIQSVTPGSAADHAGLRGILPQQLGDIIVQLAGKPVTAGEDLRNILDQYDQGDEIEVVYLRDGKERRAKVKLQDVN